MASVNRRRFLTTSAALGGLVLVPYNTYAQAPRRGGVLRMSVDQGVAKLNPLLTRVNPEYMVAELLYSALTRLKPDMSAEPDLAASWSSSPDLLEWTFVLQKGVTFHDGSPCTANDVVATYEAILDPKTASPARQNVGPIAKVDSQGCGHCRVHLVGAVRRSAGHARLYQRQDHSGGDHQSRDDAARPRSCRYWPVQAGLVRAGAEDRRHPQRCVLRPCAALSRPDRNRGLSGQHRRSLGADLRRYGHDLDHAADAIRAPAEVRRRQGFAHALGAVLQREFRLRPEAVQRCARAPGADA